MPWKRYLPAVPPTLGLSSIFLPWYTVTTELGAVNYFPWGIYSGFSLYMFTPTDPFDLPFVIVFLTSFAAIAFEFVGALGVMRESAKFEIATLFGAFLAIMSAINWVILFNQLFTPGRLISLGYHSRTLSSGWSIGPFFMGLSGISAIFLLLTKKA